MYKKNLRIDIERHESILHFYELLLAATFNLYTNMVNVTTDMEKLDPILVALKQGGIKVRKLPKVEIRQVRSSIRRLRIELMEQEQL